MKTAIKFSSLFVAVCAITPASAINLVSNGSFETGNFNSWNTQAAGVGSDFTVWADGTPWGTYVAHFSADGNQFDEISQSLATSAGVQYTISLWVKNYGIESDGLQIGWENGTVLDVSPLGTALESWELITVNATATSAGSMLKIRGRDAQAAFEIDNVSVEAVPEPATMTALGLGAVALLRRIRGTRK